MRRNPPGSSKYLPGVNAGRIGAAAFFLASTACLFLGFSVNFWHVAESGFFENRQIVMESFIVGRMVKTARDGLFSAGGLPGLIGPDETPPDIENANYQFQYQAYRDSLPFVSFTPYLSQTGGQGMLFGLLNGILPLSNSDKLSLFYGFTSLLLAVVLAFILEWFRREFGWAAAAVALAAAVLSQWLTVFGRNLWWSTWAFYLPMVILLGHLKRTGGPSKLHPIRFGAVVFLAVWIKCFFNGFEYITTALIMMTVPLVYYAVLERTGWKKILSEMLTAVAASILAILAGMTVLCVQIGSVTGSVSDGIDHILLSFLRRSYADSSIFPADYAASLTASPADVVWKYLKGIFLDLNNYLPSNNAFIANYVFQIRYLYLILLFGAASIGLLVLLKSRHNALLQPRGQALTMALWFSLLAPLSWLIIFKAHSYVHTFMNNIVWQMPFTLFGFAVCGLAVRAAFRAIHHKRAGE
jgi:hypothetical protein